MKHFDAFAFYTQLLLREEILELELLKLTQQEITIWLAVNATKMYGLSK